MDKDYIDDKPLFHSWSFGMINYQILLVGLLTIIAGYLLMAYGETESTLSVKIAPLILILGYCILIPLAILIKKKEK